MSQKDVGKHCGWSGVRTSYLENGQQNVADEDLDKLLPLYDVDADDCSQYYDAAKFAREKGWWESYDDRDAPDYLKQFVGLEQGATRIRAVEPFIVPGLLQTRDYIVEVLRNDVERRVGPQIERIADLRLRRQRILTTDPATSLDVVIDESVLRRIVRDERLMAGQLRHMATMASAPNVRVRVFPFARGINQGMTGAYRILDFEFGLGSTVYLEQRARANWLSDAEGVEGQIAAFEHLEGDTLSPEDSIALMERLAAGYEEV